MDKYVVACVQQQMHLPQTLGQYQDDLRRFLRIAVAKRARLVVFSELGGVMATPPLLGDLRSSLLKRADLGHRRKANLWQKSVGALAGSLAAMLGADFRISIAGLLDVDAGQVWQTYSEIFSGLAREFDVTIVAPSSYLPDPLDGVIRNLACVYGRDGELLGTQAKVVLHPEDVDIAQSGSTWDVVNTEVGRLGLILGSDVLYPEVGRVLAYQGADALITLGACTDVVLYNKIRAGVLARMQDNQLFSLASFLVGDNQFSRRQRAAFVGKSAIFAPQELTPRQNGVLVQMSNQRSEGVLTAEWDFVALKELWESSDTPVRQQLPLAQAGQVLAQLYSRLQRLPTVAMPEQLSASSELSEERLLPAGDLESPEIVSLDDLLIVSSITSRWPPPEVAPWDEFTETSVLIAGENVGDGMDDIVWEQDVDRDGGSDDERADAGDDPDELHDRSPSTDDEAFPIGAAIGRANSEQTIHGDKNKGPDITGDKVEEKVEEDETDEMDALSGSTLRDSENPGTPA